MRAGKVEKTPLDIYSYRIIVPVVSSSEGALMRRHGGREGMRRPRAGFASLPPGGPGPPSVPTTRDCPQGLHAARTKAGESLPDRGPGSGPVRARKLRSRGTEIAAVERQE